MTKTHIKRLEKLAAFLDKEKEVYRLFYPNYGPEDSDGSVMPCNATPKQVAREIRKFIKEKTK